MSAKIPATFWNASTTSAGRGVALEQRNLHLVPESAPHAYFAWRALPKETWATAGSLLLPSSEDRYPACPRSQDCLNTLLPAPLQSHCDLTGSSKASKAAKT